MWFWLDFHLYQSAIRLHVLKLNNNFIVVIAWLGHLTFLAIFNIGSSIGDLLVVILVCW